MPTVEPRLIFPAIQENASALSVIPAFLDTLGQKIDKSEREKDLIYVDQCLPYPSVKYIMGYYGSKSLPSLFQQPLFCRTS